VFRRRKWSLFLWVLAVASLPLRVADAHLHLCLDGQESAISVHTDDAPTHFDTEDSAPGHDDRDVEIPSATAVWKLDAGAHLALACVFTSVLGVELSAATVGVPAAAPPPAAVSRAFDLQPPVRGPPAELS
jgi:hypothetical protein